MFTLEILIKMKVKILIKDDNARFPTKANESDVGFDLVAIKKYKIVRKGDENGLGKTVLFDTGLTCIPEKGFYTEILPRSSLSKTGWMLSNSVGIIDPDYRGNLLIALTKVDPTAEDLILPFCKTQLIVRKAESVELQQVNVVNSTKRGTGGFGSTGDRI